mgnify:CR=1 FL=1
MKPNTQITEIPVEQITIHKLLQNRCTAAEGIREDKEVKKLNQHIKDLARSIKHNGQQTPARVIHDGLKYYLVDGHHRLAAIKEAGIENIKVEVSKGDFSEAAAQSFLANRQVMQPLTSKQRTQNAWHALITPHTTNFRDMLINQGQRAVAKQLNVSEGTIRSMRAALLQWATNQIRSMYSFENECIEKIPVSITEAEAYWLQNVADIHNHPFHHLWRYFNNRSNAAETKSYHLQVQMLKEKILDRVGDELDDADRDVAVEALSQLVHQQRQKPQHSAEDFAGATEQPDFIKDFMNDCPF